MDSTKSSLLNLFKHWKRSLVITKDTPKIMRVITKHLTEAVRSSKRRAFGSPNASRFSGLLASSLLRAIGLSLCLNALVAASTADAVLPHMDAKQYTKAQLSKTQFTCINKLFIKESNWRASARNGSHYGIGQLNNKIVKDLPAYRQIDYSLTYIAHRYGREGQYPNACKAYRHWQKHGWH